MENKKISFLQTFGIILVVLGHTERTGTSFFIRDLIYSFHMPLFVFISGYLLKFTTSEEIGDIKLNNFIIKKIKRLIVPYILISSLAYIPKYILGRFAVRPLELSLKDYILNMIYLWDNPIIFFWFLPTIFLIMILTIILYRVLKNNTGIILALALMLNLISDKFLNVEFLNLTGVSNYLVFFILGIFYRESEQKIDEIIFRKYFLVGIICFIILSINVFIKISNIKIFYSLIAIVGIIFSLECFKLYSKLDLKFLNHLNGKSYSIYLFSWFPQVFIRILRYQILNFSMIVVIPISFIFGIYVPVCINLFIKNIISKYKSLKFLKYIFGI